MPNTYFPSKEEFEETVESTFEKIIASKLPDLIRDATAKEYYTISETCDLLDVSRRHLQYLRDSGQINYVKNGRKVYFRKQDLDDFFDKNLIEAQEG
ncbi:MAG: helix-turn-helix domain-containing protein [Bacteroidetes bacterium]|jgi:excisionase family DNA binding protein|nr:helix-turn-helix domain-containing protein [Bacteroidota bacterium]